MPCAIVETVDDLLAPLIDHPVFGDLGGHPWAAIPGRGRVWWVRTGSQQTGDRPGFGTYDKNFQTLRYAITQAVNGRGDCIVCGPTMAEELTTALVIDKAGLSIIGLPPSIPGGGFEPRIFSASDRQVQITAANVRIHGMNFVAQTAAAYGPRIVGSAGIGGIAILNCRFNVSPPAASIGCDVELDGDDNIVARSQFDSGLGPGGPTDSLIRIKTGRHRNKVLFNTFFMTIASDTEACIEFEGSTATNDNLILGNRLYNSRDPAASQPTLIRYNPAMTGIIAHNHGLYGNAGVSVDNAIATNDGTAGLAAKIQNYVTNDLTRSGKQVGAFSS